MIKKLMFCVLTIVVITAQAQFPYVVPNIDWQKRYSQEDLMNGVPTSLDANSNVYSTGYKGTIAAADLLVLKYDSTGVLVYSYPYDYNGGYENGKAIKVDVSGNAVIAGVSEDTTPGGTGKDYIIVKLSPTGALIWTSPTRFDGGAPGGIDEAVDICVDAVGDIYCTGRSQNSTGYYDIVTLKIDGSNGIILWQHTFTGTSGLDDEATGMVLSSSGQIVYVTGNTTDATNGTDIVVYALDANTGNYLWSPSIINGSSNGNDKSHAIILSGANIIVCGEVDNSALGYGIDAVTIKFDGTNGSKIFQKEYNAYGTDDIATSLARDSTGNIGTVGTTLNGSVYEYHSVFYDSTGTQYKVNIENTSITSLSVDPKICNDTIAHHWYVSGEALKSTKDIFVYQITPTGNTSWRQYIDGPSNGIDGATGCAVNGVGVVYAVGLSQNLSLSYDYTTIKLNQTPVYWPPDFSSEPVNYNHLYIKNNGQLLRTDSVLAGEVLYYTHNTKPEVFIEQDAFNFVYRKINSLSPDTIPNVLDTAEKIHCKFMNCNPYATQHEFLPTSTVYNYYLGYASNPEITDLQGNQRIFVPNLYPSIDLHYFSGKGGIKYYLVLKPYAVNEIQLHIDGSQSAAIDGSTGNLVISGALGTVELNKPVAYTVNMLGAVVTITATSTWIDNGGNNFQVAVSGYNTNLPLIIEVAAATPTQVGYGSKANLDYSTLYGSSGDESFNDIKAATNGDRHVTGWTTSQFFPVHNSLFSYKGDHDVIVLKYTADDTLRVATCMGDINKDDGNSIDVNSAGEVFVGGTTASLLFPTKAVTGASNQTANGFVSTSGYYQDGFLAKFSPTLTPTGQPTLRHTWGRFVGGPGDDFINSIFVDGSNNLHFVGEAKSYTMAGLAAHNATTNNSSDAILGKFDSNLSIVFGSFFGGSTSPFGSAGIDRGLDITVDNSGNIIICGQTDATNFPVANNTGNSNTFYHSSISGTNSRDGFLARFSPTGTKQFASYFGGHGIDEITRLAHEPLTDETFFAGDSNDTTAFPFLYKANALNSRSKIYKSAFVGQMGGDLTKIWCSYYGKGANSTFDTYVVNGLCVDGYRVLYLSGVTTSDTLHRPLTQPTSIVYKDSVLQGGQDGFIAIFNNDQSLYHAHYYGGSGTDGINGADISQGQKLYVVGNTQSSNFPIAYNSVNAKLIDSTYSGGDDGFISRFDLNHYQITGLKQNTLNKTQLSVYPNPANVGFNLDLEAEPQSKVNLRVYSLMGQLMYEQDVKEKKTVINCESWAKGVYLISVSNNQGQSTFKLVKN